MGWRWEGRGTMRRAASRPAYATVAAAGQPARGPHAGQRSARSAERGEAESSMPPARRALWPLEPAAHSKAWAPPAWVGVRPSWQLAVAGRPPTYPAVDTWTGLLPLHVARTPPQPPKRRNTTPHQPAWHGMAWPQVSQQPVVYCYPPTALDDVLGSVRDGDAAKGVHVGHVARGEPALTVHGGLVRLSARRQRAQRPTHNARGTSRRAGSYHHGPYTPST